MSDKGAGIIMLILVFVIGLMVGVGTGSSMGEQLYKNDIRKSSHNLEKGCIPS